MVLPISCPLCCMLSKESPSSSSTSPEENQEQKLGVKKECVYWIYCKKSFIYCSLQESHETENCYYA